MFTNQQLKDLMMVSARIAWRAVEVNDVAALTGSVPKMQLSETVAALDQAAQAFAALESGMNPGLHHAALEFSESAGQLKHQFARRCCGVDSLLVQVQIDATSLQSLNNA
jgi:hypothetical protein